MLGGVSISYRQEDSDGFAGRIYDRLANRLGRENVFFDVDAIPPGRDFIEILSERVGKCDALLAVIGNRWISSGGSANARRLAVGFQEVVHSVWTVNADVAKPQ